MRAFHLAPLYPITSSAPSSSLNHVKQAEMFLAAGIRFFQVREKSMPDALLYRELLLIRRLCNSAGAVFLVNDRIDLALAVEANGVHLGQTDLPVDVARRLLGRDSIIGLSSHNQEEFLQAQEADVDYVAIGPVFATSTKKSQHPPLGIEAVCALNREKRFPMVAIGGIRLETAGELWEAGVDSVAVISDLADAPDPMQRIKSYLEARTP